MRDDYIRWPDKSAADVLNFSIDFGPDIDTGDGVASVVWAFPAGITKDSQGLTGNIATVIVSGGTADTDYRITATATLTSGLILEQQARLTVRAF